MSDDEVVERKRPAKWAVRVSLTRVERCVGCDAGMSTSFECSVCGRKVCGECFSASRCCAIEGD